MISEQFAASFGAEFEKLKEAAEKRQELMLKRQPAWSPSKTLTYSGDGVTVKARRLAPQKIVSKHMDNFEAKEASVPYQPYELMIDPAGNVVCLAVSASRIRKAGDSYGTTIMIDKLRAGWLPFDRPPMPVQGVPDCGAISRNIEEWQIEREKIIQVRQMEQARRSKEYADIYRPHEEALLKSLAEQSATASAAATSVAMEKLTTALVSAMEASKSGKKNG